MFNRPSALTVILLGLPATIFGCGQASSTTVEGNQGGPGSNPEAESALVEAMISRESIVFRSGTVRIGELFPRTGADSVAEDAFLAQVVAVEPGRAFDDGLEDGESQPLESLTFDDPEADWRSFHVRVEVVEPFVGDLLPGDDVTLGLAFGSQLPLSTVVDGFTNMERLVVFTRPGDFVVPYDPSITPVLYDGAFLSPVEGNLVPFPALVESGGAASLVAQFDTLPELRSLAEEVAAAQD